MIANEGSTTTGAGRDLEYDSVVPIGFCTGYLTR